VEREYGSISLCDDGTALGDEREGMMLEVSNDTNHIYHKQPSSSPLFLSTLHRDSS